MAREYAGGWNAAEEQSGNPRLALQAGAIAFVLFGLATRTGSAIPIVIAVAALAYAAFNGLQVHRLATNRDVHRTAGRVAAGALAVLAAATVSVFAVNSGSEIIAIAGNLSMLATVLSTVALLAILAVTAIARIAPRAVSASSRALANVRTQVTVSLACAGILPSPHSDAASR